MRCPACFADSVARIVSVRMMSSLVVVRYIVPLSMKKKEQMTMSMVRIDCSLLIVNGTVNYTDWKKKKKKEV